MKLLLYLNRICGEGGQVTESKLILKARLSTQPVAVLYSTLQYKLGICSIGFRVWRVLVTWISQFRSPLHSISPGFLGLMTEPERAKLVKRPPNWASLLNQFKFVSEATSLPTQNAYPPRLTDLFRTTPLNLHTYRLRVTSWVNCQWLSWSYSTILHRSPVLNESQWRIRVTVDSR